VSVLQFIASIVNSLAWPLVVLGSVVILRGPLRALLPLLQRLKYKDLELDFGQQVRELNAEVAAELPAPGAAALPPIGGDPVIARLAETSPRAAVLEAWRAVEAAALLAARRLGGEVFRDKAFTLHAIRFLEGLDGLDSAIVSLLRDLRGLRNQAAHAPEFALSPGSALEYAAAADRVASYLRGVARAT
jgi:hypothetical protein